MALTVWLTVFLLIFALGYPVAFGMFISSVLYLIISGIDLSTAMDTMVIAYENQFVLLAVPLFIFSAKVMNAAKLTDRLFDFAKILVGPLRGGLGHVNIVSSIIFAGMFALGIALISTERSYTVDLAHFLFGDVLGVSDSDLWLTAGLGALILIAILVFYRPFLVISFDPILAATLRMRVDFYRNLLLILLALTIVVSMQTVGVGLVAALLVTPAATAYLLVRRLPSMMALSALFGAFSSITGLFASYYLNVASGAAIVLTATILFLLAFLFSPSRGFIWEFAQRRTV